MIHFKPLIDRKKAIIGSVKFDLKWIEEEPTEQQWTYDADKWRAKTSVRYRRLEDGHASLGCKHIQAYKDIVFNRYKSSLILEDDVILCDSFEEKFNLFLSQTPSDWDFIYIGSACGLRVDWCEVNPEQSAYKRYHPASKCTDSYCIKLEAAEKILETIIPFSCPIDFELNYQMELHNMNVYWWEPTLVEQGSHKGLYGSSIQ
tara:strand:- start:833 stop:1441 length:609 start_codon:yes stop_codon:yes gene_type:complete